MSNNVNTNHLVRTLILFVVLIAGFFVYSKFFKVKRLPPAEPLVCVYPIVNKNGTQVGIGSQMEGDIRVTAQHVLDDCKNECSILIQNFKQMTGDLKLDITESRKVANDTGIFQVRKNGGFVSTLCKRQNDGFVTYVSGEQQKIPVNVTGTFISYTPDFGQSGSPYFEKGRIIGVMSKKWISGWVLSLIDGSNN